MKHSITVSQLAKMIDHSILHPTFTDEDLRHNCHIALQYHVASVCVKPYHVKLAAEIVQGSDVAVCAVIGFPHGNSTIGIKVQETLQVIADGATEVDMVINIGKALQHDWQYLENEISAINQVCIENHAVLKVIFETDYISDDKDKIRLCEICNHVKVGYVKTSTGYGFTRQPDGSYNYHGATDHDLKLMRQYCNPAIGIKASGGIRKLEDLLRVKSLGASRVGVTATKQILDEALQFYTR
ncbi:MAG TPA: deoxyribose-phosphate aldolase [Bacteroidales bacterium]|nr:deoxyribose-phosphate aldolase [Bacteroidales bacterium]